MNSMPKQVSQDLFYDRQYKKIIIFTDIYFARHSTNESTHQTSSNVNSETDPCHCSIGGIKLSEHRRVKFTKQISDGVRM